MTKRRKTKRRRKGLADRAFDRVLDALPAVGMAAVWTFRAAFIAVRAVVIVIGVTAIIGLWIAKLFNGR